MDIVVEGPEGYFHIHPLGDKHRARCIEGEPVPEDKVVELSDEVVVRPDFEGRPLGRHVLPVPVGSIVGRVGCELDQLGIDVCDFAALEFPVYGGAVDAQAFGRFGGGNLLLVPSLDELTH